MLENASFLEIAFTAPSAVGALFSYVLLVYSIRDDLRRRALGVNGLVRLDAQKAIVTAVALSVALSCLTWIGVNAMATPPNPLIEIDPRTASTAVLNALLFVVTDLSLISLTVYRFLQRGAVQRASHSLRRDRRATDQPEVTA